MTSSMPQVVPASYGGKWVAWTKDAMRIAGVGESPDEARSEAHRAGIDEIFYEWIPPADELFIGAGG